MEKRKIEELMEEIKKESQSTPDISNIVDYSPTNYLTDIIFQIADNYIDIYNYNLLEWLKDNYSEFEETIDEYGLTNEKFDLMKWIQMSQGRVYEGELLDELKEIVLYYICYTLKEEDLFLEITEEEEDMLNQIAGEFADADNLPSIEEIKEAIENF